MTDNGNDHSTMLRDSVADFCRDPDLARVRALAQNHAEFESGQWRQLADMGWLSILVPEAAGGLGLGLSEAAIVAEGLGRALTPEPYTAVAVLSASLLMDCLSSPLAGTLLGGVASGECVAVAALQEAAGDFEARTVNATAQSFEGGYRLNGQKQFVIGASGASGFIVQALLNGAAALFWVPAGTAGCETGFTPLADGRRFGSVSLADVSIPADHLLADGPSVRAIIGKAVDHAAAIASAELVGLLKRTQEMSLEYMKTRVQFGKAIGSFQVLQHRAVDLYIQQELADAVLREGIAALDAGLDEDARAATVSRIKARCAEAALQITRAAIQFHGAIGFTEDCDVGLYVKRAMTLSAWLGNPRAHRQRYAAAANRQEAA